jgi:hypothetical protein
MKPKAPEDFFSLLDRGSREHYADPDYYDRTYRARRDDVEFYRATARRLGGPVLELGVGSGRVARELARDPDRAYAGRPFVHPTLGRVRYTERFQYDAIKQVQLVTMRFEPEGRKRALETVLAHRQVFPAELRALLATGGLRMTRRMGDFSGRPLGPDDDVQILEAAAVERPVRAKRA